ncbi:biotin--[acetyl-CoA-carboxylase] ligase [Jiella endophytica]|uniref:biotin--[biotin carboxyl-carrier protein] ligase n=1 Tax=Jiella endophytica TaxID=2558362 RepID=A0A4Y8RUQ8_9HYPH|nr:biotin--[acetyl-CoA-carboxylase] ligase [Jiella endophytica]TFF27658.1 biotin--[acetyl-CoA-carboxylase] ligase [Jiella endophytica]
MASGFNLSPTAVADGFRLESFAEIGSTNQLALERARAGDPGGLWLVTGHQTGGRGRRGRAWEGPPGNLAATLLLQPKVELSVAATLGFVAALALRDALLAVLPEGAIAVAPDAGDLARGGRFALKWPNDVLADGAKLSGILLETAGAGSDDLAVAIGIGVNVVAHPEATPYPATDLGAMGATATAADLFFALSDAFVDNLRLWQGGRGLAAIRHKWLAGAAGIGSEIAVDTGGTIVRGVFETIDADCHLVIREGNGQVTRIAAGDVHFGAVASVKNFEARA